MSSAITIKPNPAQKYAIPRMTDRNRDILALNTGEGKSLAALIVMVKRLQAEVVDQAIIVSPKTALTLTWKKELRTWGLHRQVTICLTVDEVMGCLRKGNHFATYYNVFTDRRVISALLQIDKRFHIILDECQTVKNNSKRRKSMLPLSRRPRKFSIHGLSATVMAKFTDIWGVIDFFYPGTVGTKEHFIRRYCTVKERERRMKRKGKKGTKIIRVPYTEITGYKNIERLAEDMKDWIITFHNPRPLFMKRWRFALNPDEWEGYVEAAKGTLYDEDGQEVGEKEFGARLHPLQEAADAPVEGKQLSSKDIALARLLEFVKRRKLIIYSARLNNIARLEKLFKTQTPYKPYVLTGEVTKNSERESRVNAFKNNQNPSVLLISSVGSVSLNLDVTDTIILYSLPFSLDEISQVVGRITRYSSPFDEFFVWAMEARETIDSYKVEYFFHNSDIFKRVLGFLPNVPAAVTPQTKSSIVKMRQRLLWTKYEEYPFDAQGNLVKKPSKIKKPKNSKKGDNGTEKLIDSIL